jgi:NADPH:quinone reductase-like Zn-dependent oxidoreductase
MRAWQVAELDEPRDVLRLVDVAEPEPAHGQLVARVLGARANFPHAAVRRRPRRSAQKLLGPQRTSAQKEPR